MITLRAKGNFSSTYKFLEKCKEVFRVGDFNRYGRMGVEALRNNTPKDTGKTSESWEYEIKHEPNSISIIWKNSNQNGGVPIAILIQYGHASGDGAFVQGIDFINPSLQPVFDEIAKDVWEEVTKK